MKFVKMQAVGNDYIYISHDQVIGQDIPGLARNLSRRRFSVGSDGIIVVEKIDGKKIKMRIFNADGSEGATRGNGVRCSAVFARKFLGVAENEITVLTKSRETKVTVLNSLPSFFGSQTKDVAYAKADMGSVFIGENGCNLCENLQKVGLYVDKSDIFRVNAGNEHLVFFTNFDLEKLSSATYKSGLFKDGINVERVFSVQKTDQNRFRLHAEIFERGSGKTLSCGSGAVAIAFAFAKKENLLPCDSVFEVVTDGESLFVTFTQNRAHLYGEVVEVYQGELSPTRFKD